MKGSARLGAGIARESKPGKQSLVKGESVNMKRKPRTAKTENLSRADLIGSKSSIPLDADVYVNGHKQARLALYVDPTRVKPKAEVPYWAK